MLVSFTGKEPYAFEKILYTRTFSHYGRNFVWLIIVCLGTAHRVTTQ